MYTIYFRTNTHCDHKELDSLWAANLIAYKYVAQWGWDSADVVDNTTGEVLKTYIKG